MSPAPEETTGWRSRLRRWRRYGWKLTGWFIIGSAVLVALGRLSAPYADRLRPELQKLLSQALDQPVRMERIEASWPRLSPRIELRGLQIGPADAPLLDVDRAVLDLELYNLLRPARNSLQLVVIGLQLTLQQAPDGHWRWRMDGGGQLAEEWERVVSAGDLVLRDSRIRIQPHLLPALEVAVPEAQLLRRADQVRVGMTALPIDGAGESLAVRLALDFVEDRLASLSGYAESPNFLVSRLALDSTAPEIENLRAETQVWTRWNRAEGGRVHALVDLHSQAEGGLAGHASSTLRVDGRMTDDRIAIQLDAHEFDRPDVVLIDGMAYGERLGADLRSRAFVADRIELDFLHALLDPWLHSLPGWPERVSGQALDIQFGFDRDAVPYRAAGRIERLELALEQPEIGVSGLDLGVTLVGDAVRFRPSGAAEFAYPLLYKQSLQLRDLSGAVDWRGRQLAFRNLKLDHIDLSLNVHGRIQLSGASTWLDLLIETPRLSTREPSGWLPERGIPPKTRRWLTEALLDIGSVQAATTLFGQPARWREGLPHGGLHSEIRFQGLDLAYGRNWPVARGLNGQVAFVGESMRARAVVGQVADVAIDAQRIDIADLRNAELELELQTRDAGADGLARLAATLPIGGIEGALSGLAWQGEADAEARIWLPVRQRENWRLIGDVNFANAQVEVQPYEIVVDAIDGQLPFNHQGLGPATLRTRVAGQAVDLALEAEFRPAFSLALSGRMPVQGLLPVSWHDAQPDIMARLNGASRFDFRFAPVQFDEGQDMALQIQSRLDGVTLDLPPPMDKPGEVEWPLDLTIPLDDATRSIRFALHDRARGILHIDGENVRIGAGLGGAAVPALDGEDFLVRGRTSALDAGRWLRLLRLGVSPRMEAGATPLQRTGSLVLSVDDFLIRDASLGAVDLNLAREQQYWRLEANGEQVLGSLRLPAGGSADSDLVLDLERLHWPEIEPDPSAPLPPPASVDPSRLPALNIAVNDLRWGALALGSFRLQSHGEPSGLVIEQISSRTEGLELTGNGRWQQGLEQPFSEFRLRLTSEDLGSTLSDAGYDLGLERGNAEIVMDGRWPGSPLDLSLRRLDGTLEVNIEQGAIEDAGPGAGRLLGLVSLGSIPRRLRLDFTDVFGEGLAFDSVSGVFELNDGVASTDNLRINAPAAEIRISGRTLLRERRYDQVLRVRPGVGATLPIIGALAGGPVGAAAGVALEQLFAQPLRGVTEVRYRVTGPFDAPVIEPLSVTEDTGG